MARVLVTGMSGVGKSTVLAELRRRGVTAVDTDYDGWVLADGRWDEPRIARLLDEHRDLVVSGTVDNQGRFYDRFEHVVLLSAPLDVLLDRVGRRAGNPYGKSPEQQAEIRRYADEVEPLLRDGAGLELDGRLPVSDLADTVQALVSGHREHDVAIRPATEPGDLGWVVMAHGEVYAEQFGWDTDFEALVAQIVADYAAGHDPDREAAWIATVDGERAGCVLCVAGEEPAVAKLRILLVTPGARGLGLGARLVDTCVRFAAESGYRRIRLWTNDVLVSARRIYEAAGFTLVGEERHHSFGHDLVGQTWSLDL